MEVLRSRVSERNPLEGKYQGTLAELEESVSKIGDFEVSRFTRVFDTHNLSTEYIAREIEELVDNQ